MFLIFIKLLFFYLVYLKKSCGDYKIFWVYGGVLESKEFLIFGKVYLVLYFDFVLDEFFCDVLLYYIIRKLGNWYVEKIIDFDRKFKNEKKIDFFEVKEYKRFIVKVVKEEILKYDVILCIISVVISLWLLNVIGWLIY